MIDQPSRSINESLLVCEQVILTDHLSPGLKIFKLKVRKNRLSIWILENQHILLVLIIPFYALTLKSILLSHALSLLPIKLVLGSFFLKEFPFLSSLSLLSLMLLHTCDILIGMLFFVLKGLGRRFKGSLTEFIFTRAFKCLIMNYFSFSRVGTSGTCCCNDFSIGILNNNIPFIRIVFDINLI